MPIEFGLYVEAQEGVTWADWHALARHAEDLGFASLQCSVHLTSLQAPGRWALDPWPVMTALALWTRRIHFGLHVLPVTFYHPALVARLAAALDRLSGGRFRLGLGAGRDRHEHDAFGLPFLPYSERVAMLGEAVEVIRLLWGGEPVTFQGRWYRLHGAQAVPTPQAPHLGLGGNGDPILRLAAARADEWCTTGSSTEALRGRLQRLDALAGAARRSPTSIVRTLMNGVVVGRTWAELEQRARRMGELAPDLAPWSPRAIIDRLAADWHWWVGTPEAVAGQVTEALRTGIHQVLFQVFDFRDLAAIDLLAREVLPRLKPPCP